MLEEIALTVIARDRPGLVKSLSETIARHGGNWIDSSMARLGGESAGMLRVSVPSSECNALQASLGALSEKRRGDPVIGGSTRQPIMTAYRQQALHCASALAISPGRPRDLKPTAPDAPKILQRNVYGWFARIERGRYG